MSHTATYKQIPSPFDYANNSILYCAAHHPDPSSHTFRDEAIGTMSQLIKAASGRALALFTSNSNRDSTATALHRMLDGRINVERQGGELTNQQLRTLLGEKPNSVVCGSRSFWQGIDIPGPDLSLVIIDRLPFKRPDDPICRAQLNAGREWADVYVPDCGSGLAQMAGRLIRTPTDRGVVAVMDPRLATMGYRKLLLAALPPMRRSTNLEEATEFLQDCVRGLD